MHLGLNSMSHFNLVQALDSRLDAEPRFITVEAGLFQFHIRSKHGWQCIDVNVVLVHVTKRSRYIVITGDRAIYHESHAVSVRQYGMQIMVDNDNGDTVFLVQIAYEAI